MDKFKEIRDKIGKDLIWRLPKANKKDEWSEIVFNWKFNIGIEWYIHEVGDEFRTNKLSNSEGRYTVINFSKNQRGRIYTNVHFFVSYTIKYFRENKSVPNDFDFIYVWDGEDKKLIVIWENNRENNRFKMGKEFADRWFEITGEDPKSFSNLEII
jgi:hypothetical protein